MVGEHRRLFFTQNELVAALCAFARRRGTVVQPADIKEVNIAKGGELFVDLHFHHAGSLTFKPEEITAAFISYCRDRKIPLPQRAIKLLTTQESMIVLEMFVGKPPV